MTLTLQRRLRRLLEQLSGGKLVPPACGDWAATKVAYRFFDNPRVTEHGVMRDISLRLQRVSKPARAGHDPAGYDRVYLQSRIARQDRLHKDHQCWAL
ncbi:transposase DNA-binding-containing protein [Bradyrhizobium sp. LMG 9283]|uniref:transposase DNA-binding-containing protein n=1 Tax=Bradyrhizobium sp. LMG 9283 TaxID=592064 RepID=UPI00388D4999